MIITEQMLKEYFGPGVKLLVEPHDGWVTWYRGGSGCYDIFTCPIGKLKFPDERLCINLWPDEILALANVVKRDTGDGK